MQCFYENQTLFSSDWLTPSQEPLPSTVEKNNKNTTGEENVKSENVSYEKSKRNLLHLHQIPGRKHSLEIYEMHQET